MRFVADESCDCAVVNALRAVGHDVVPIAEISPRADDEAVIDLAVRAGRMLLTEDKDFGQPVYANRRASSGVVLVRVPTRARAGIAKAAGDLVRQRGDQLAGHFTVGQPGRIRIGASPED